MDGKDSQTIFHIKSLLKGRGREKEREEVKGKEKKFCMNCNQMHSYCLLFYLFYIYCQL